MEWHNPSGTSIDGRGDPLEQRYPDVGDSKTTTTFRQQLTIIYSSMFRLHTVAQERERERERERVRKKEKEKEGEICKVLWTDTQRHAPTPSPTEISECKPLIENSPADNF